MRLTPPRPQVELLLATSAPERATLLQNAEEDTPLHMAVLSGAVGAVGLLADARSVRAANVEGFTALHYAAGEGDVRGPSRTRPPPCCSLARWDTIDVPPPS
jgi:ankyrin repeat protein